MTKVLKIRYTLQSGVLPNGLKLNPDTGEITGSTGFDALGRGPTWTGPEKGSLGSFVEGDAFPTITFQASSPNGPVRFGLASDQDRLPWGITLDAVTGQLVGSIADLKQRTKEEASTTDGPNWGQAFGRLAGYDEGSTASLMLSATPRDGRTIVNYQIVDGNLPWGLSLNFQTGRIAGTVARLKVPGPFVDVPKLPLPVWSTPEALGTFNETTSFDTTVTATPAPGRSMSRYQVINGGLPFGLRLDQTTGRIYGTLAEILKRNEPAYLDNSNPPVFQDSVLIQETTKPQSNPVIPDGGSLGSYPKGFSFAAMRIRSREADNTPPRTMFVTGNLPFGLRAVYNTSGGYLDFTGTISTAAHSRSGTYTFTVTTVSKTSSDFIVKSTTRTYSITVQ